MEKYSGIHDDHRYENKLTRVSTFCFIAHCNWSLFWTIFSFFFLKYLNIRTKIFKYLNGSRFKYSDNSIWNSNMLVLYSHEVHADSKFGQTYYTIWFWQCIVEQKRTSMISGNHFSIGWWYIYDIFSECMLIAEG